MERDANIRVMPGEDTRAGIAAADRSRVLGSSDIFLGSADLQVPAFFFHCLLVCFLHMKIRKGRKVESLVCRGLSLVL